MCFQDRFAEGRYEPGIDESQDWFLTGYSEYSGRTILEFKRKMTACEEKDLDITVSYHKLEDILSPITSSIFTILLYQSHNDKLSLTTVQKITVLPAQA